MRIWIVQSRRTRQILAFFIGDGSMDSSQRLWRKWPYDYLRLLDVEREASFGYSYTRRKMTFSPDGKGMTTERTWYTKEGTLRPEKGTEKWERK